MTADEKRIKVREKYKTIIGRNIYSQNLRNYCYKKYSNGKYYSDCSSSVSYTYRECGFDFGIMRTTDMYATKKFVDVPVTIKNGLITNPEVLKIGDMLLFAGNDTGRKKWGYVGHVEMVGEISGKTVMLYGHGSGNPKRHEMNSYCKSRYSTKASTPLGRRLLIKVRRFIVDDDKTLEPTPTTVPATPTSYNVTGYVACRHGRYYVRAEANKNGKILGTVKDGDNIPYLGETKDGWNKVLFNGNAGWLSGKAGDVKEDAQVKILTVKAGTWYVRTAPSTGGEKIGVVTGGETLVFMGLETDGWYMVEQNGATGWISKRAIS